MQCFVFVNKILCTSLNFVFIIIITVVELKSYSNVKDTNIIKIIKKAGCCAFGGGWYSVKLGIFIFCSAGFFVWFSGVAQWIGCQVVPQWLILGRCYLGDPKSERCGGAHWPQVVEINIFRCSVGNPGLECCYCVVKYLFRMCGNIELRITLVV